MITEINFCLAGGAQPLIMIPVHVNGRGPYEFILDTGAGVSLVSPDLARSLGIEGTEEKEGRVAGGSVKIRLGKADSLAVGAARLENAQVAIMDFADIARAVGTKIDGDIGYNFLKHFRLTIDYRRNLLRLAQGEHRQEAVRASAPAEVSFKLAHESKPLILLPVIVNGQGPFEFALDTGASNTIISPALAAKTGIKSAAAQAITTGGGHTAQASFGAAQTIKVGTAQVSNLPVMVSDLLNSLNQVTGADTAGIIGYNFLKTFRFTIDHPEATLRLQ